MTWTRWLRRALAAAVVSGAVVVLVPGAASAHPLGNFTVNRYSGLVVGVDSVQVDHVLDLAEIPTAQRMPTIDRDGSGEADRAELATYARGVCSDAAEALELTVAGAPVRLVVGSSSARTVAGQAGLPTLRVSCGLSAATAALTGATRVSLVDAAAGDEIGWREMTAAGDGTTLVQSDVPARSESRRLTRYPADLLSSPLDVRSATVRVTPGGAPLAEADARDAAAEGLPAGRLTSAFESLVDGYDGSPLVALVGLLAAVALGAAHALAPGHGKTVMAFYLSGRRDGAARAAATVAATVTVTHTAGVLLLGVLVSAGTGFVPARLYPWLTVASGLLVAVVGLTLLRTSRHPHAHDHPHPHDHQHPHPHPHPLPHNHPHDHQHPHPHPHAHGRPASADQHAPLVLVTAGATSGTPQPPRRHHWSAPVSDLEQPEGAHRQQQGQVPASRRSLVAMGMAGGMLPSPSALVVFLGALAVGHAWFGVLLVTAFGLGMAATLAVVGLVVMRLRRTVETRLAGRAAHVVRALPVLTALTVLALGLGIALKGAGALGG